MPYSPEARHPMPELPEVETTRRGLVPHLLNRRIQALRLREARLRWPVPAELVEWLPGRRILGLDRRAKYLLVGLDAGHLILHLGMSGSLRVLPADTPPQPHEHLDLVLEDGACLRLRDPRRFGALLWSPGDPLSHPLLRDLGPEPLEDPFDGDYLYRLSRRRRVAVKALIMDGRVVVGIGNIYANEALFRARIHPQRAAGDIGLVRYRRLATAIRQVLTEAIEQGGTSLRDFNQADGRPGYFAVALQVYGRAGQPCPACGRPLLEHRIGQRSSFFCGRCQR